MTSRDFMSGLAAWRLRLLLRAAFTLLLAVAILLPFQSLQALKTNSYQSYIDLLGSRRDQIFNKLSHPSAQLGLLNPKRLEAPYVPLRLYVLPYALEANYPYTIRDYMQALGCAMRYPEQGVICAATDSDEWTGAPRIYVVGSFLSTVLTAQAPARLVEQSQKEYSGPVVGATAAAHRIQIDISSGERGSSWLLPVQVRIDQKTKQPTGQLAMTAYRLDARSGSVEGEKVAFNSAWIRQGACRDGLKADQCQRESVFAIVVSPLVMGSTGLLDSGKSKLEDISVRVRVLAPPGVTPAVLLDSNSSAAAPPFARSDLLDLLSPDESLQITEVVTSAAAKKLPIIEAKSARATATRSETIALRVVSAIPVSGIRLDAVDGQPAKLSVRGRVFDVKHSGNVSGIDVALAPVAERILAYSVGMFLAICIAWITIELGIVRYVARLTRRAAAVSSAVRNDGDLGRFEFADLRGRDEVGVLAGGLDDLLKVVADKVEREKLRLAHEENVLRAIGHEVRSPIQSLKALHEEPSDPSYDYIKRMDRAVKTLYGNAAPEDAIVGVDLEEEAVDLNIFLESVAANAPKAKLTGVRYVSANRSVMVRIDPSAFADVLTHVLQNAVRYRNPETIVTITLEVDGSAARVCVHDIGPQISDSMLEKIFEYGVSDRKEEALDGGRGQGLFVARSYMTKMGGTIIAKNEKDGVTLEIRMPLMK